MTWYRRVGDRRGRLRFEVIGERWGTLTGTETLRLRNLGRGGALIEAPTAPDSGSTQKLRLVLDTHVTDVQVLVRHVSVDPDTHGSRFLMGVEFVDLPAETAGMIDRLLEDGGERDVSFRTRE